MTAKTYNAGTIFLQVVPVFGDVQNAIRREAKDWNDKLGDEMEKGGEKAGQRAGKALGKALEKEVEEASDEVVSEFQKRFTAGIKDMNRSLEPIDLRLEPKTIQDQFKQINKDLDALEKRAEQGFVYEADVRDAEKKFRVLHAQLEGLREDAKVTARLDVDNALKAARRLEGTFDSLKKAADIEMRLETKVAERALGAFEKRVRASARKAADSLGDSMNSEIRKLKAELEGLADAEIGIDIDDAAARAKIESLMLQARRLSMTSPEIDVKVDAGAAEVELARLYASMKTIDGKDIDIKVDVDSGGAAAQMGMLAGLFGSGGAAAGAAANSFRSFRFVILAVAALLPALIPIIGGVGGALLGLLPILGAVGAGFGAMLVGFSGIGDAVGALGDVTDNAAKDSAAAAKTIQGASYAVQDAKQALADAERNAAQAAADAARAVADARRAAADAIEDALDRQREAQEAYRDSVKDVQEAEQNLREARKRAVEEQRKNADDIADQRRQNSLAIRQAVLDAFDATNNFNAVMADGSSTTYDKEQAEIQMLQAREHLHELREEQTALAKEAQENSKNGVKNNEDVQSAQDQLTSAIEAQKDAEEALGEAAEDVAEARIEGARRVADAIRNQQRVQADGARAVARAQEQLRRAQEGYGQALSDTGEIGSASMQKLEEAMGKLGPAGRKFARFLFSLRDDFFAFRDAIQEAMLPGVQRALEGLISTYGPQFTAFMVKMGRETGFFFESLSQSLQGPAWRTFFGIMDQIGPKMARQFGQSTINWMETFANIMIAVAPFAERMSQGMLDMSEAVKQWSASEKGQGVITGFMEYASRVGPKVIDFLSAFVRAAVNLMVALAPWGGLILEGLTKALDLIAEMDPKTLGLIAGAVLSLVVAWQAATGVVAGYYGIQAAVATTASRLVFGLVGIVAIVALLAIRFESVRDALGAVRDFLLEHIDIISKLAAVVLTAVAAYRTYRFVVATIAAVQVGLTAATYGAAGATYAQGAAAKTAYIAMRIWRGVMLGTAIAARVLGVAMTFMLGPWGLVILAVVALVAGLVLAYKKVDWFRAAVDWAARKVGDVFQWLWELLVEDIVPGIIDGFQWAADKLRDIFGWIVDNVIPPMVDGFQWLWGKLEPVFRFIGNAAKLLWRGIRTYFTLVYKFWRTVFKIMRGVWREVLWPVLDMIIKIVVKVWKSYFKVYFGYIKAYWTLVFKAMKVIWNNVLYPVIRVIWSVIKSLWKNYFKPNIKLMKDAWDNFIKGAKIVWERFLKPAWEAMKRGLGALKTKFDTVVDNIKSAWDRLKGIVARPIRFVIETVLNNGLIAGFNKVADFVGSKQINDIPIPKALQNAHTGGVIGRRSDMAYADGGTLPGYTPGKDVHHFYSPTGGRLNLSGGEAVMRPEFTAALGTGFVDGANAAARAGGIAGVRKFIRNVFGGDLGATKSGKPAMAFARGGVIPMETIAAAQSWAMRHRGATYAMGGAGPHVFDCSGFMAAITNFIRGQYPYARLGNTDSFPWPGFSPGSGQFTIGNTGAGSAVGHMSGLLSGLGVEAHGPTGARIEVGRGARSVYDSLFDGVWHLGGGVGTPIPGGGVVGKGGGISFPKWIMNIAKNPLGYVKGLVSGPIGKIKDKFGDNGMVKMLAAAPGKLVGAVKDKVVDILPGPLKSLGKGIGKVGSLVEKGLDTVGLATGGVVGRDVRLPYNGTMQYDAGGYIPPGLTSVVNLTGKPEPVFTAEQFKDLETGGRAPLVGSYSPTFEGSDLSAADVMDEFEFALRKMSRSNGKYEGV